jgi:hypothetical protein
MRVNAPTLKREAPPAAKRGGSPATNGRVAASAKRAKAPSDGEASANGHKPARAAKKPARRRTSTAR